MSDQDNKREIRRMLRLLRQMAGLAEHVEQTGSFESGVRNSVKRYNSIVEHLEDNGVLPEEMFPKLEEEADFGQLGAEATLLADYLNDMIEEEEPHRKPGLDLGPVIALAPFLGQSELKKIVRAHFAGKKFGLEFDDEEEREENSGQMDLRTLVGLAPHIGSRELGELVRAYLATHPQIDPNQLVALAPHMKSEDLGAIIREYMPTWFGGPSAPRAEAPPQPPPPPGWNAAPRPPEPPAPNTPPPASPAPAPHPESQSPPPAAERPDSSYYGER